jgi:hypothetical protein
MRRADADGWLVIAERRQHATHTVDVERSDEVICWIIAPDACGLRAQGLCAAGGVEVSPIRTESKPGGRRETTDVEVLTCQRPSVVVKEQDRDGGLFHTAVELRPNKHPARRHTAL